jgi:multidrug efflux system membrane fusion protein
VGGMLCLAASLAATGCNRTSAEGTPAGGGRGGRGGGAQPVVTARATEKDVPVDIPAVGNVEAYNTINLSSQVTGQLLEAFVKEGDFVKKGDRLFKIDPRPFESMVKQADANLLRDKSLLKQAEAQLLRDAATAEYQQLTSDRQTQLVGQGIISKDQADQARTGADAAKALVEADKAAIESAKAQAEVDEATRETAKVQLSYCDIFSPLDGRTGNMTVKQGNLITANATVMMTVAQVQPVYVTFSVPAVHFPSIRRHMAEKSLSVVAIPQDADKLAADGLLTFVDNIVDPTTDTIKLKATFANADRRLWPGQFARVSLRLDTLKNATVVPSQAVQTGQNGQFVFLVNANSTVEARPVVVSQRVGEDSVIEKGLKTGDVVVTDGQLQLNPGMKVSIQKTAVGMPPPKNSGAPPSDSQ